MAHWNKQIKDYFTFSKIEQRGIAVLIGILFILILTNIFLPWLVPQKEVDFSDFQNEVEAFEARIQAMQDSIKESHNFNNDRYSGTSHLNPFTFDPNNLPGETWKALGLNDKQIETIKNFEKSGGTFKKKEDLAKIYTISDEEYIILEPYIIIKEIAPKGDMDELLHANEINPFPFDPNTMTLEMGQKLGLKENTVKAIINYRKSGGLFISKEDLKKIYTLSPDEYEILESYILITPDTSIKIKQEKERLILAIEINSTDTLELQQLKGIGPSFARRIIKYRDMLGGYHSAKQLLEVYGMDSIRFAGIADHIVINDNSTKKININTATVKEMIKHPYIEFYLAKSIITYRTEIEKYTDISQIKNAKLIYEELFQKIAPYLTIENIK